MKSIAIVSALIFLAVPGCVITPKLVDNENTCIPGGKKITRSNCPLSSLCVPLPHQKDIGRCLVPCGEKLDGKLVKASCPENYSCMLMRRADLAPVGMFCEQPAESLDQNCAAAFDDDACHKDHTCLPTKISTSKDGRTIVDKLRCKQECSIERPCADKDVCQYPDYARSVKERNVEDNKAKKCSVRECASSTSSCACTRSLGFRCQNIAPGVDIGICVRRLGVCLSST